MSIITAYKCDKTGKLFEDRFKYLRHLKKVARDRLTNRQIDRAHRLEQQWWHDNFWNRVQSLAQLQAAILHHRDVFAANGVKNYWNGRSLNPTPIIEFISFNLTWSDSVSNTHSCTHNGVLNFYRDPSKPKGYQGWIGSIGYDVQSFSNQLSSYPGSSDMWNNTRIHTGSGGGGGHKNQKINNRQYFSYGVKLFADDWPKMKKAYEHTSVIHLLNGSENQSLDHLVNKLYPAEDYFEVSE